MRRLFILLGTISLLSCSAVDRQDEKFVLWVNSSRSPCVGLAPTKCLQVQKSDTLDTDAWESFHSPIEGFEFEPGYFYKIVVQERHLGTLVPADSPSIAYALVEILEKRQDQRFTINGVWKLRQLNEELITERAELSPAPRLEIQVEDMRYMGNDGCNNFNGGIIELDEHSIHFGIAAGTRMMCPEMSIPDLFNASLPDIMQWTIAGNELHLSDASGQEVMRLIKTE